LLKRSHIVADNHRYIGKETSRRWEQGHDMSLVDFRCAEYGDGKTVASHAIRKKIIEIGIRRVARRLPRSEASGPLSLVKMTIVLSSG